MSRNKYTPEFKTKLVIGVLQEDKTLDEIACRNSMSPDML